MHDEPLNVVVMGIYLRHERTVCELSIRSAMLFLLSAKCTCNWDGHGCNRPPGCATAGMRHAR